MLFEISRLVKVKIDDKTFDKKQLLKDLLDNRFGITKNMDDKVYNIKLEFTNITGSLVQKYTWHHSQKFELQNGNHIMTLRCGINREFMGWIFQWMYNVRKMEAQALINSYNVCLNDIKFCQNSQNPLVYHNHFEPKKSAKITDEVKNIFEEDHNYSPLLLPRKLIKKVV